MKLWYSHSHRNKLLSHSKPLTGKIELTDRCNLKCKHCFLRIDEDKLPYKELSLKEMFRIISEIAASGTIYLGFSGGEPLLHPHFKQIYYYAKKKRLAVCVSTNATLLDAKLINFFKKNLPINIEVSSYGYSREAYEKITRIPGSFERFKEGVRLLKNSGLRMSLRLIVMRDNYNDTINNLQCLEQEEVPYVCSLPILYRRDGDKAKNRLIIKQQLKPREAALILNSKRNKPHYSQNPKYRRPDYALSCTGGTISFHVDPYGNLMACPYLSPQGVSLKNMPFAEGWDKVKGSLYAAKTKDLVCGDCRFKSKCYWCPGAAFLRTGSTNKKIKYLCQLAKLL